MTITLELTEEQERKVLESAGRHDEATLRRILMQALESAIAELMQTPDVSKREDSFETLARQLTTSFTTSSGHASLPEEALTREGIYGDHP